jgi:hypothetical protein
MICGSRTYIPDLGQHRFCTLELSPGSNPNHDMPNQENKLKPHQSGEWVWATPYPEIGPEMKSGAYYSEDDFSYGYGQKEAVEEVISAVAADILGNLEGKKFRGIRNGIGIQRYFENQLTEPNAT